MIAVEPSTLETEDNNMTKPYRELLEAFIDSPTIENWMKLDPPEGAEFIGTKYQDPSHAICFYSDVTGEGYRYFPGGGKYWVQSYGQPCHWPLLAKPTENEPLETKAMPEIGKSYIITMPDYTIPSSIPDTFADHIGQLVTVVASDTDEYGTEVFIYRLPSGLYHGLISSWFTLPTKDALVEKLKSLSDTDIQFLVDRQAINLEMIFNH